MAPDEVALAKVIRLMDGPIALALACVSLNYYERCEDCKEEECGSAARNGSSPEMPNCPFWSTAFSRT